MSNVVKVIRAGLIKYSLGLKLQQFLIRRQEIQKPSDFQNYLVIQEHYPVYTIGLRTKGYNDDKEELRLRKLGADFFRTNRGGLITFHGPGQMVSYPLLHLQQFRMGMRVYVSRLEQLVIETCSRMGLEDATTSEHTGVWVKDRKICAIGVHGSRYITSHGIGLNCSTDLNWFEHITPCGIEGKGVTSLSEELERSVSVEETIEVFLKTFQWKFNCKLLEIDTETIKELLQHANLLLEDHQRKPNEEIATKN